MTGMRGEENPQPQMFSYVDLESRVPQHHPIRKVRRIVDEALAELAPRFEAMYSERGRRSIPPEQLLRALLLQIFFSIRSERLLVERIDYDLLFRWFVGLGMLGGVLNSLFGKARLEIGPRRFVLERQLLGWKRKVEGNSADLSGVELQTAYTQNGRPIQSITLLEGVNTYKLGTPLTSVEKAWLVNELDSFIKQMPQRSEVFR
jgi:hypothetical protein